MKKSGLIVITALLITAVLATAMLAEAQYHRRRRLAQAAQKTTRPKTPEQMAIWLIKQLKLTEKEAIVVLPEIKKLLVLKYREIPGLRKLRAIQKDKNASDEEIAAGLKRFRKNLAVARMKIIEGEKKLVDMKEITPQRELTLTINGILDNGRMSPRMPAERAKPKKKAAEDDTKQAEGN